jgi:hypothetical protein
MACDWYRDAQQELRGPKVRPYCKKSILQDYSLGDTKPMNPLASFAILIATAQSLADAVWVRDNLYLRPTLATKAVAARLASGLIVLRSFLRRLIILIALKLEWDLVDKRGVMKRPHGRKMVPVSAKLSLTYFDSHKPSPWLNGIGPKFKPVSKSDDRKALPIDMANLYAQLDFLAGIATNPLAKAQSLAFHLARRRHGILMAPMGPKRIAGRWGTQVSAFHDAIGFSILEESRHRPPSLPPRRTYWPTITAL